MGSYWQATLVAICCFTGCGEDDTKSDNKGTLQVKGFFDMSGSTADVLVAWSHGIIDQVADLNANGGIQGYHVNLDWYDNANDSAVAVEHYNLWKTQAAWPEVVAIFGNGTASARKLRDDTSFNQDQKPYFGTSYAADLSSPIDIPKNNDTILEDVVGVPYMFHPGTDYSSGIRIGIEYMAAHKENTTKIAFAYDNSNPKGFPVAPIAAGKAYAAALGVEVGPDVYPYLADTTYQTVDDKVKTYFEAGANSDVEWLWIGNTADTASSFALAALRYGPANLKIMSNVWGFDESFSQRCATKASAAGIASNLCLGTAASSRVFGVAPFAAFGDTSSGIPGMSPVVDVHSKYRQATEDATLRYVQGYVTFYMWRLAVERLVAKDSAITGPALKSELESFRSVSTGGLTTSLTMTPEDHRPTPGAKIYSLDASGLLRFEDEISVELKAEWRGW